MKRTMYLAYSLACYTMFLGVFLYAIGFMGNIGIANSLDAEPRIAPLAAVGVNLLLLAIFAIQHSLMARPTFKRWWTNFVPTELERSTYVLFSNVAMILMFAFWQPMGGVIWNVPCLPGQITIYGIYALGWATVLYTTCLLNHFELFGLRQAYLYFKGKPYTPLPMNEPSLYKHIRHPLYVGWLMAIWATPTMTVAHLLFAIGTTAYILVAIQLEERNLCEDLPGYAEYRKRVPMLIPRIRHGETSQQDKIGELAVDK